MEYVLGNPIMIFQLTVKVSDTLRLYLMTFAIKMIF